MLGMIGETIDGADEICGARVVDKSVGNRCTYRLELWFRKNDEKIANELLGACSCLRAPDALCLGCSSIAWQHARLMLSVPGVQNRLRGASLTPDLTLCLSYRKDERCHGQGCRRAQI